ncbi:nuclear speckle RNA-binding protein A-like isoform X2 [Nymphaea colorata]|uniref:nuclear speckle RNA-binding protein A-like isoform X2 n=1 Tax=Nymphaea colorata TaxID=210225 RepID=UPI00129E6CFA|nr:nuclear speckle RNA-binding protein A-like isoform X2 [Nymphaea colorata]
MLPKEIIFNHLDENLMQLVFLLIFLDTRPLKIPHLLANTCGELVIYLYLLQTSATTISGVGGVDAGTSLAGLSNSFDDQFLLNRRRDLLGIDSAVPPVLSERAHSLAKSDVLSECTNILFVEGLPSDCTRREVSHLFRPFIGFKEIRVIHKECRRLGEKAFVICFVEFKDEKCAATALEALQGYRFDDKKPDSPVLRIQFARFPFRPHDRLQNNAL